MSDNYMPGVTSVHIGNEFTTADARPYFAMCRNDGCDFEGIVDADGYPREDMVEAIWTCPDCRKVPERKNAATQSTFVAAEEW